MADEGRRILEHVESDRRLWALTRGGKGITSRGLASVLESLAVSGHPGITFVIGGAHGLGRSRGGLGRRRGGGLVGHGTRGGGGDQGAGIHGTRGDGVGAQGQPGDGHQAHHHQQAGADRQVLQGARCRAGGRAAGRARRPVEHLRGRALCGRHRPHAAGRRRRLGGLELGQGGLLEGRPARVVLGGRAPAPRTRPT